MQRGKYLKFTLFAGVLALAASGAKPAHAGIINLPLDQAQFIGTPTTGSNASVSTGLSGSPTDAVYTLTGLGADITGTGDNFEYVYTNLAGDGGITARVLSQTAGDKGGWAKSGVMIRESTDPGSAMAAIHFASVGTSHTIPQVETLYRQKTKANVAGATNYNGDLTSGPIWLRAQRQGQDYQLLVSRDGNNWLLIGDKTVSIDASKGVLAGLSSTAHGKPAVVATFDNVSVDANQAKSTLLPGPDTLMAEPGNGVVLLTFSNVAGATGYNVYRREVGQTADKAVLVNAKPISVGYITDTAVTNGKQYLYFVKSVVPDSANPKTATAEGLVASGDALVAPNVAVASNVAGSPGYQVYYWTTTNPATVDLTTTPGMLTVKGSGADIWGAAADSGTFIATPVAGDYSFSAELEAQPTNSVKANTFAKAGVMIRDGVGPADRNAYLFSSAGRDPGVLFEGKTIGGFNNGLFSDAGTKLADTKFPLLLKLTKAGSLITAFQSSDAGATFAEIGTGHDFVYLSPVTFAGIAISGRTDGAYTTATFSASSVKIQ